MENCCRRSDQFVASVGRRTAQLRNAIWAGVDAATKNDSFHHSFALRELRENRINPVAHLISGYATIAFGILSANIIYNLHR